MKTTGAIIVSWDCSHSQDRDILIVGEQVGRKVDILNAIQGPEVKELLDRLIIPKRKDDTDGRNL